MANKNNTALASQSGLTYFDKFLADVWQDEDGCDHIGDLQQNPGNRQVGDSHPENIPAFKFLEQFHCAAILNTVASHESKIYLSILIRFFLVDAEHWP